MSVIYATCEHGVPYAGEVIEEGRPIEILKDGIRPTDELYVSDGPVRVRRCSQCA